MKTDNELIAEFMGFTKYPKCKVPSYFYDSEQQKWDNLEEMETWVNGETEAFKNTPCVSSAYWEYERGIEEKQFESYYYSLKYNESWGWLMPVWFKFRSLTFKDNVAYLKHAEFVHQIKMAFSWSDNIEDFYKPLNEGIKWYNSQKQ